MLRLGILAALLVCIAACSQAPPTPTPTPEWPKYTEAEAIGVVNQYLSEKTYQTKVSLGLEEGIKALEEGRSTSKWETRWCSARENLSASYDRTDFRWLVVAPADWKWYFYERTGVVEAGDGQRC